MLKIEFSNQIEKNLEEFELIYIRIASIANDYLKIEDNFTISVTIVDNNTIKEINKSYRMIDKETDVISFAFLDVEDKIINSDNEVILGDIYIAYEVALRQAQEYQHSLKRELSFLFLHGLLHLLDYDHLTKEEEEEMFTLQEEILKKLEILR